MNVYLIHCQNEYGLTEHYLGSTADGRLRTRLQDHMSGNGHQLTAVWGNELPIWYLTRLWKTQDRTFERAIHTVGGYEDWCPLCRPHLFWRPATPILLKNKRTEKLSGYSALSWRPAP